MHIADVLATKGRRIETVWPSQPVRDLPRLLIERNVASLVVVSADGRPLGMVTDRLLLEVIAKTGGELGLLTVREIMIAPPPACRPDDTVMGMLARMTDERVRHLLVLERDHMVGLVSIGDLVKHRLRDADMETRILRDMALAHLASSDRAGTDRAS